MHVFKDKDFSLGFKNSCLTCTSKVWHFQTVTADEPGLFLTKSRWLSAVWLEFIQAEKCCYHSAHIWLCCRWGGRLLSCGSHKRLTSVIFCCPQSRTSIRVHALSLCLLLSVRCTYKSWWQAAVKSPANLLKNDWTGTCSTICSHADELPLYWFCIVSNGGADQLANGFIYFWVLSSFHSLDGCERGWRKEHSSK